MHMLVDEGIYSPLGKVHKTPAPMAPRIEALRLYLVGTVGAEVLHETAERVCEVGNPESCSAIKLVGKSGFTPATVGFARPTTVVVAAIFEIPISKIFIPSVGGV
jgi:hypothetical protein